jgi:hypothetical protein
MTKCGHKKLHASSKTLFSHLFRRKYFKTQKIDPETVLSNTDALGDIAETGKASAGPFVLKPLT